MAKGLVSIFDEKAEVFGVPTLVRSVADAERMFLDILADKSTLPGKHPEDFKLFLLGHFDEDAGVITPVHALIYDGSKFEVTR